MAVFLFFPIGFVLVCNFCFCLVLWPRAMGSLRSFASLFNGLCGSLVYFVSFVLGLLLC